MAAQLKDPHAWFAAGRIMACQKMPYFSAAVMGLVPYPVPGYGTLGVTARAVLVWDPELSKTWTVENLAWVLLHEAGHYLREHAGRRDKAAALHELWNIAGDAEINDDLISAGAKFPVLEEKTDDGKQVVSGVTPALIGCEDGRLCEEYYEHLRKHAKVIQVGVATQKAPGGGQGKKGKGGGGRNQQQGDGDGQGQGKDGVMPQAGKKGCGSGSGALPDEVEAQIPGHLGKSQAEQKRVQREVAQAVRAACEKSRGTVPAGIARWAEDALGPPHVPWQQKLARVCRSAIAFRPGVGDYRYDRPSRRQGAFGYGPGSPVFPALRQPIPRVAEGVDTSGSMSEEDLKVALQELKGILSATGATVDLLVCDAEVHGVSKVRSVQEAAQRLKGGGGTDMRPLIDAARTLRPKPEVLVIVTDGHIGDPGPPPAGINVVWVVVGHNPNPQPSKWGETVVIPPQAA